MGEGGGALLIETEEHALARGARIICRLAGYGNNTDGYHVTAPRPDGSGAVACMKSALEIAGMGPADIDYINAHGTSTPVGDPTRSEGHKVSLRRNGGLHTCRKLHKGQHRPSHGSGRNNGDNSLHQGHRDRNHPSYPRLRDSGSPVRS